MTSEEGPVGRARLKAIAPQFVVTDVVHAAEYYRDVLGFEIRGYFLDPPVYAIVGRDEIQIHFGKGYGEPAPNVSRRGEGLDAYILVDDVDRLAEELSAQGADLIEGPVDRSYGRREITVRDCFGFTLAFGT